MSIGQGIMRRIRRVHLFWLAVIVVGAGYIFLSGRHPQYAVPTLAPTEAIAAGTPIFADAPNFVVSQLVLVGSGRTTTAVKQGEDRWEIRTPFSDVGDAAQIGEVIGTLLGLRSPEKIETPSSLAEYGFDKPQLIARLSDASGKTHEIIVGARKSTGVYYVKTKADAAVYAVGNLPPDLLDMNPFRLVRHTLLRFDAASMQKIVVRRAAAPARPQPKPAPAAASESGGGFGGFFGAAEEEPEPAAPAPEPEGPMNLVIERGNSGAWISRGGKGEPDRIVFNVDSFLEGLQYVQANNLATTTRSLGFFPTPGSFQVEMTMQDNSVVTLNVGRDAQEQRHYVARVTGRPQTYQLVEFVAENLRHRLNLIDTSVLGINTENLAELKLAVGQAGAANPISMTRDEGSWKSADSKVAFGVATLVSALDQMQAVGAAPKADPTTFGFTSEAGGSQVTLTLQDKNVITLDIGKQSEDGQAVYVRSSNRPEVYLSPANIVNQINEALREIRTSLVVFSPADVTQIKVTKADASGGQESATLLRSGNGWAQNGAAKDANAVTDLLTAVQQTGAAGIADRADEPNYKFFPEPESYRIALMLKNGATQVLDIGGKKQVGSGWFASTNYFVRAGDLPEVGFIAESDAQTIFDAIAAATGLKAPEGGGDGGFGFGF